MLPSPAKEHEGHASIADFLGGVCRPLDPQAVKSVAVLFDAHVSISEFGSTSTLTKLVAENKMAELPHPVHFPSVLPETAKLDIIVDNTGDGFVSVLKVICFERPVPTNVALKLCSGQAHVPVHRHGPWTVKKGLQQALNQVAGVHVRWHVLEDKGDKQGQKLPRSTSSQWSPENDELAEGIRYINAHAPECDGLNEQTYWILTNIKADSGSPVAGWPEIKVRAMCQNKSRGLSGAIPKSEFSPDQVQSPAFLRGPRADSHLPLADEHSHHDAGMSWCWEDSSNHCYVHGHWAASCPATPSPRCQTGLEARQELLQFPPTCTSSSRSIVP